jgi:hypothetical protein
MARSADTTPVHTESTEGPREKKIGCGRSEGKTGGSRGIPASGGAGLGLGCSIAIQSPGYRIAESYIYIYI